MIKKLKEQTFWVGQAGFELFSSLACWFPLSKLFPHISKGANSTMQTWDAQMRGTQSTQQWSGKISFFSCHEDRKRNEDSKEVEISMAYSTEENVFTSTLEKNELL